MTILLVMETALYILLLSSFYMCLGLNNTIRSTRSSRISFLSVLMFHFYPLVYLMCFDSVINLVWSLSLMVGYFLKCCPVPNFQQNSEIIILISRRIFQLRSALVASTPQYILLTSSQDPSGLNQLRLPVLLRALVFGYVLTLPYGDCGQCFAWVLYLEQLCTFQRLKAICQVTSLFVVGQCGFLGSWYLWMSETRQRQIPVMAICLWIHIIARNFSIIGKSFIFHLVSWH